MNEQPICMQCKHRMVVKFDALMNAQGRKNNGQIVQLGPVRQEVTNSACKKGMIPIGENPRVIECSEFEVSLVELKLKAPMKEVEGQESRVKNEVLV